MPPWVPCIASNNKIPVATLTFIESTVLFSTIGIHTLSVQMRFKLLRNPSSPPITKTPGVTFFNIRFPSIFSPLSAAIRWYPNFCKIVKAFTMLFTPKSFPSASRCSTAPALVLETVALRGHVFLLLINIVFSSRVLFFSSDIEWNLFNKLGGMLVFVILALFLSLNLQWRPPSSAS